jgi:hypothetical protein
VTTKFYKAPFKVAGCPVYLKASVGDENTASFSLFVSIEHKRFEVNILWTWWNDMRNRHRAEVSWVCGGGQPPSIATAYAVAIDEAASIATIMNLVGVGDEFSSQLLGENWSVVEVMPLWCIEDPT